jgi:hypothetical protein
VWGPIKGVMSMIPGLGKQLQGVDVDEAELKRVVLPRDELDREPVHRNSTLNLATRAESLTTQTTAPAVFAGGLRADDGTRTHDLLHRNCSQPFAPVRARSLKPPVWMVCVHRAGANPSETPNLAILATASGAESGLVELLGDPLGVF